MEGSRLPSRAEPERCGLSVVGIGPGRIEYMTARALKAIAGADHVIGNASYLDLLGPLLVGKHVIRSSMGREVERAQQAIDLARSSRVAIVSGGDPGIYGMASIILEVLERKDEAIDVEIIPGITAANAAASRLGAPLSGDFAVISLSDLLTPIGVIEERLEAVFSAGIPVVLYNPKSRGRPHNFSLAIRLARNHRDGKTPVGVVKNALRDGEEVIVTTLDEVDLVEKDVDMHTTVIIGGKESRDWLRGGEVAGIITPRGYHVKYVY